MPVAVASIREFGRSRLWACNNPFLSALFRTPLKNRAAYSQFSVDLCPAAWSVAGCAGGQYSLAQYRRRLLAIAKPPPLRMEARRRSDMFPEPKSRLFFRRTPLNSRFERVLSVPVPSTEQTDLRDRGGEALQYWYVPVAGAGDPGFRSRRSGGRKIERAITRPRNNSFGTSV
jgi:hypothetical protein